MRDKDEKKGQKEWDEEEGGERRTKRIGKKRMSHVRFNEWLKLFFNSRWSNRPRYKLSLTNSTSRASEKKRILFTHTHILSFFFIIFLINSFVSKNLSIRILHTYLRDEWKIFYNDLKIVLSHTFSHSCVINIRHENQIKNELWL